MSTSQDRTSFDVSSKRLDRLSVSEREGDASLQIPGEFSTSESHRTSSAPDDSMKLLRCSVSSLLCFFRATFSYNKEDREDTTESDFFFFINACRCKDKKHLFTDVSSFDSSDGIIVNQDRLRLQEGMVDFFTDEINTYLVGNNESIACTGTHQTLHTNVKDRLILFKKLNRAVEELACEIPNHGEMFTFVMLRKDIKTFDKSLSEKNAMLKVLVEPLNNLRENESAMQCQQFLKTVATDTAILLENCELPDNWTKTQFFQVLCEEVMTRAMKMIDVDKIFLSKSNEGSSAVLNALRLCMYWKTVNEHVMDVHRRVLKIKLYEGNMFGSIMAFIRRCKDLYEICQANGQLFSTFNAQDDAKDDSGQKIDRIYLEYSKLLSNISTVRHKCLDIKDDELGNYFVSFRKEMHSIDSMILDALKASFDGVTNIKEQCEILDTFHSMSERARVRDTYYQRADAVGKQLYNELSKLIQEAKQRLNYTRLFYPALIVNFIRAHGLIQRGNAVIDDVTGSNVFLGDVNKLKSINRIRTPLKKSLDNMLVEYRRNTHFLDGLEVDFKNFLITRSAGFEGALDINVARDYPIIPFMTKMLECVGLNIISTRASQFRRQETHRNNITVVARLVTEYNAFFACRLSSQEKGIFRGKVLSLERKIWNGVYKLNWGEQSSVAGWCKLCEESIWTLVREIIEYKKMNSQIQGYLNDVQDLKFVHIDGLTHEYEPDEFCSRQHRQINVQANLIKTRCVSILAQVAKIKQLADIEESVDENLQWNNYKHRLATKMADSIVNGLAKSLKQLATLLYQPQNKPMIKVYVTLKNRLLTIDDVGKDVCLFLDSFKETAATTVTRTIVDKEWSSVIGHRIENEPQLIVLEKILQIEVEKCYVNVQKYLHTMNPLKDFWTLSPDNVLDYYRDECDDVDSFLKDLTKLKNVLEVANGVSRKKWVNYYMIDATASIKEILRYCKEWEKDFITILCTLVEVNTDESQSLLADLATLIEEGEIQGKEDYMDEILERVNKNTKDTFKVLALLTKNGINTKLANEATKDIEEEYLSLKRDKNQILLQHKDASLKSIEQMKQLKIITKSLDDLIVSYKVQAPYTASWKSEEALSEINNYNNKLRNIKEEVTNYDLEENIEHYHDKCIEMEMNLLNLKDIWQVVTNWESFEQESNEKKVGDLVVQEVMVSLNSIKEEISRFCKRSFDSRIEIHMTLQTKLSILEGNFSLIEDFRSKAIKSRHWEIISKVCGFDAIRDGEEVIDVLTLEDFINLGLEKQGSEIKSIIAKAEEEFTVEEHLSNTRASLPELCFKYKTSVSGIRSITNDESLQDMIQNITKGIAKFKESEASDPFKEDIDSLELKLTETKKKIDLIKKVESIFGIISEVSTSYSLDLQLGKFQQKLSILTEIWKNIHQDISEHSDLVEAMNNESLESNLWSFELEMQALENKLMTFLATRKFVYPKFALCSTPKIKTIFSYRDIENLNKWISLLFPHVQKLVVKREQQILITGYVTKRGFTRNLPSPLNFDWSADYIACKLQEALRVTFREEIAQNLVPVGSKKVAGAASNKQEARYTVLPMHTTFVIRHLAFCTEFQRYFSEPPPQQKTHSLEMLVQQNNRITTIASMIQDAKTEDASTKCNDAMGIEVAIKQIMEKYVELVFAKDVEEEEKQQQIKSRWIGMIKYSLINKDPLDIQVMVHEKPMMFGFDETAICNGLLMVAFREDPLGYIGKLLIHSFGSVLDGQAFSGRFTSMQCFSQILGRHLVSIAYFDYSLIDQLDNLLVSLEGTQDYICFHNITTETVYNKLFTNVLTYHMKVKEFKGMILNKISISGTAPEKFNSRIFYQTTFPPNDLLYVGKEYRVVAINTLHLIQKAQFALLTENFSASLKLIQLVVIGLTVVYHHTTHQIYFSLRDMKNMLKRAQKKIATQNASDDEAILGAILEAYPINRRYILNLFKHSVNITGIDRLIETQEKEEQIEYGKKHKLTFTPYFKKMLHNLTYSLMGGNHVLLYGGSISLKTSLWKVATSSLKCDHFVVSNLALESPTSGLGDMKHIPLLEKKRNATSNESDDKELLLVLEGKISPKIESILLSLLQYDTFVLKNNGQLATKERKIRIVMETGEDLSALTPSLSSFFHLHKCSNEDITWQHSLASKIYQLTSKNEALSNSYDDITKTCTNTVECFINIRIAMDLPNNKVTQDCQLNSLIGFFSSVIGLHGANFDIDDLQQMIIYSSIFCFSQDVPLDRRHHMEIKIRELYECRFVPTEQSIFDYFYDPKTKMWKGLKDHPMCSKAQMKAEVILLRNHMKQEIIARMMIRNLVSVDFQGEGGVGKTTMLKNLLQTFNTSDFLGVSIPSCKGTSLSKITYSILNCLSKQPAEGSMTSPEDAQETKQVTGAARRNVLFCIDDVDANDKKLSDFIKFFTEHFTWLTQSGLANHKNQVIVTTRLQSTASEVPFKSVRVNIDPIESQELTSIFKTSLKEKFIQFELDIQFLITKVIMASVDINRIFMENNVNRVYFHVQDNMKIILGLSRAHKDCHDTKFELLELWVNEVYRAYFEKIPSNERSEMYEKVSASMMHYFGDEAKELLEESHNTMIGDFLDPYSFYTVIEEDELKDFVKENLEKINAKLDIKLDVITNKTTLMEICQLLRALAMENGHMLIYGTSLISPQCVVELACRIKGIRMFKLLDTDITAHKWKKKFRSITKICGLDKLKAALYVPLELFDRITEVRACLESFIDIGYDLSLFQPEELEIMTQKQGYFQEIANNTKKNFHCIVVGKTFEEVENHFSNENFYVSNTGEYLEYLDEYAEELMNEADGIPLEVFKTFDGKAHEFFENRGQSNLSTISVTTFPEGLKPSLPSYICFMNIFNKYIEHTKGEYDNILNKIETIVQRIEKHFEYSEEQNLILEKNREKSKSIAADHAAMTVKQIQTKKELKEIENNLEDGMNEYGEEQAAMLRLNMAIVEERACQWSLYQRVLRDLEDAVLDESNMNDFNWAHENFQDVQDYVKEWRTTFELSDDDFCINFKITLSKLLEDYNVKSLWTVGENDTLRDLKNKIYHEVTEGSIILHSILKIHQRIEQMSKSTKNIVTKEQKLQTLQKKCKSIEEKLKNLRQQIKNLEKRLQDEITTIEELQANQQAENEKINTLEHSTTEHKNLKQPLQALLDLLEKMKIKMLDQKERLPGSICLAAAVCGYCGCLGTTERLALISKWKDALREAEVPFQEKFLPYAMSPYLRSQVSISEAKMTTQNLSILSALDDPILIIDPYQISLEYLELLHVDDKITMLHIGDPTFRTQFLVEAKDSNVIIIFHSTLDLNQFVSQVDIQKVKLTNQNLVVYHVTPAIKESELVYIQPSQIISFDMGKDDIAKYVHNRLQLLTHDKSRIAESEGDGNTIATEKDRLDVELDVYVANKDQILDFNFVQASVEHIKKIHDQAEKVSDKKVIGVASMWSGKMDRGPIDLLQRYSDILTNAFMALQYCPFQNTVPVALQTCLFMSKKILEALEALEKKEWTHEKIATTVADGIMKIYDTNLSKFDSMALKTCLLFYLFANCEPDKAGNVTMLLSQLSDGLQNVTLFVRELNTTMKRTQHTNIVKATKTMLTVLTSDYDYFEEHAEKICSKILPQKINNDRDLYRVYAKSAKDVPTVINVDIEITFLEALSKFSVNFTLDDFMVLNVAKPNFSPFRLLEEAIEKGTWLICTGIENRSECENILDFMIRRLKTSPNIHDNFRFWIICQDMKALTLSTAQKCCSHYLGHEVTYVPLKSEDYLDVPISAFKEAQERLKSMANYKKKKYYSFQDYIGHSHLVQIIGMLI